MTSDELHLYENSDENGRTGSWTAVDMNGSLRSRFGSRQEKEFTLAAAGYRLKTGLLHCLFHPQEPEIWVRMQS